ncbi:MAG: chromosome segregation protein SMC [Clostridia bacterium]|jgi:chromosome segregation protein|nr:chromosome segregation protein SMC [Clostridia bacterium]MCI2001028.1 chromosome segregation protein SMC [Clostridia bacterium]MCI2015627.1 chromosome segregation protein SMC [Clostridia bacterium]
MYLKELDIHGFKSFPEKVKLQFNRGITAVVGPNGSGKSNISDAVRWVIGEQRAKNLRGDKMEDVIFAGTAQRKPIGFAEVSLTLDNEDKKLPLDYSEITVKRTVFRSGESKYTINGTACRLKDIHELFMDTGIGRDGYSIIGQGKIDEILSNKSEDRRQLFEEAAGIAKYRSRRAEALSKLDKERQNLVRVDDILNEIKLKLNPLKEQCDDAKKYLELRDKLKKSESDYFCIQDLKMEKEIDDIQKNKNIAENDIKHSENEIKNSEEFKEKISLSIEKLNENFTEIQQKIDSLKENEQSNINNSVIIEEQIKQLYRDIERTKSEQQKNAEKTASLLNEKSLNNTKLTSIDVKLKTLRNELDKKNNKYKQFIFALENNQKQLDDYKSDIIEKVRVTTEIKTAINQCELILKQNDGKVAEIEEKHSFSKSRIDAAKVHMLATSKQIDEKQSEKEQTLNEIENLKADLIKFEKILCEKNDMLKKNISNLNESLSKYKILSEMKSDFDGFYKSVRAVLKESRKGKLKGIFGAIGEVIKTDKKYENAIETALGAAVQNIITDNEENAKNAIYYLKKYNLGRATFMPVSVINGKSIDFDREKILSIDGICGIADELVSCEDNYREIIRFLLGRTIIAENMESALKAASACGRRYKIVTVLGDVINPGGTMTGGSTKSKTSNIFSRNREISELESICAKLKNENEDYKKAIDAYSNKKEKAAQNVSEKMILVHKNELETNSLKQELERTNEIIENEEGTSLNSDDEKRILLKERQETSDNLKDLKCKLEAAEKEIESENKDMEKYSEELASGRNEKEGLLEKVNKLQIEETTLIKEKENFQSNIKRIDFDLDECKNDSDLKSKNIVDFKESIEKKEEETENIKKLLSETQEETEKLLNDKENISQKINEANISISECEKEIRQKLETVSDIKNEVYRLETKLENIKSERQRIIDNLWDEYEITPVSAKRDFDDSISHAKLDSEIKTLKSSIKNLGYINVKSIDEYKEQSDRYNFMSKQREDIKKAEDDLVKLTDDLEELIKKQFAQQFKIISDNFNIVFREMFGGGKAYLKLSDSDILESGIEIIAQPPGKNMQNMMLLSGGERALTAIAILFAILKMKPSPFCILDEIEAALDDSNVKRFADYLKKFSSETQFIVITHRKGTMEAADVLYGVTMQEKGISRVLSVNLEDYDSQEA